MIVLITKIEPYKIETKSLQKRWQMVKTNFYSWKTLCMVYNTHYPTLNFLISDTVLELVGKDKTITDIIYSIYYVHFLNRTILANSMKTHCQLSVISLRTFKVIEVLFLIYWKTWMVGKLEQISNFYSVNWVWTEGYFNKYQR